MGMEPYTLKTRERSEFVKALNGLNRYELDVLWSLLSLLSDDHDLSDLNGLPALLDTLIERECHEKTQLPKGENQ